MGETLGVEGEVVEDLAAGLPPDVVADSVLAQVLQTQPVREGLARGLDADLDNKYASMSRLINSNQHCSSSALTGVLVSPMLNLWPSTLHTDTPHLDTSALASWGMYWAGVPPVTVLHLQTVSSVDEEDHIDCR